MKNEDLKFILENIDSLDKIKKEAKELAIKDLNQSFKLSSNGIDIGVVNVFQVAEVDYNYKLCFIVKINGEEIPFDIKTNKFNLISAKEDIYREMRENLMNAIWKHLVKDMQMKKVDIKF